MQDIPSMCQASAACSLKGFLYVYGGFDLELKIESHNRICVFNCTTGQWLASSTDHIGKPHLKRRFHTLSECNGVLVAIGGMNGHKSLSHTEYVALAPVAITENSAELSSNHTLYPNSFSTKELTIPAELSTLTPYSTSDAANYLKESFEAGSIPAAVSSPAPAAVSARASHPAVSFSDRAAAASRPPTTAVTFGTSSSAASSASDSDASSSSTRLKEKMAAAKVSHGSVPAAAASSPVPIAVPTRASQPATSLLDRAAASRPLSAVASGTSSSAASSASDSDAPAPAPAPAPSSSTSLKERLAAAKLTNATHWTNGSIPTNIRSSAPSVSSSHSASGLVDPAAVHLETTPSTAFSHAPIATLSDSDDSAFAAGSAKDFKEKISFHKKGQFE